MALVERLKCSSFPLQIQGANIIQCAICNVTEAVELEPVAAGGTLSVGSGYAWDTEGRWQECSAVESQELEGYSLGSGYT